MSGARMSSAIRTAHERPEFYKNQRVSVEPIGIQRVNGSYYPDHGGPIVCSGRSNLTALSQTCNLYFVAKCDQIWVQKPESPKQMIKEVALVLYSERSASAGPGYIDIQKPHAINHLLRGELGHEEIIVCACDDGDVYAYYVRAIFNSLKSRHAAPQPFFKENVGASAWGLAIHKQARLIAVSSNSHHIDLFAPALAGDGPEIDNPSKSHSLIGPWKAPDFYKSRPHKDRNARNDTAVIDRSITRQMKLCGHGSNIPSISFSQSEPNGRWLASTDIGGDIIVWDIHKQHGARGSEFLHKHDWIYDDVDVDTGQGISLGTNHWGWGVLCLDSHEFIPTLGHFETWGGDILNDCQFKDVEPHYDIYNKLDTATWTTQVMPTRLLSIDPASSEEYMLESIDEGSDDPSSQLWGHSAASMTGTTSMSTAEIKSFVSSIISNNLGQEVDSEGHLEENLVDDLQMDQETSQDCIQALEVTEKDVSTKCSSALEASLSDSESSCTSSGVTVSPPELDNRMAKINMDPFCLFHTSALSARLFINPVQRLETACQIRNVLLSPDLNIAASTLRPHKRLNMITDVPELGIVIVGSPEGTVGVFTLTKNLMTGEMAMRLDHLLPTMNEEIHHLCGHELFPLIGIAIAPMQGQQFPSDENRSQQMDVDESWRGTRGSGRDYRLMLTYRTGFIVSYRVSRNLLAWRGRFRGLAPFL